MATSFEVLTVDTTTTATFDGNNNFIFPNDNFLKSCNDLSDAFSTAFGDVDYRVLFNRNRNNEVTTPADTPASPERVEKPNLLKHIPRHIPLFKTTSYKSFAEKRCMSFKRTFENSNNNQNGVYKHFKSSYINETIRYDEKEGTNITNELTGAVHNDHYSNCSTMLTNSGFVSFSSEESTDEYSDSSNSTQGSKAKELLDYRFEPWTEVSELIKVHSGIYSSIRFECPNEASLYFDTHSDYDYGKKVFLNAIDCSKSKKISRSDSLEEGELVDSDDELQEEKEENVVYKLSYSRDKLTKWKASFRSSLSIVKAKKQHKNQVIFTHLIAIESILNALLEQHRTNIAPIGNNSVLHSLYSIAVINFCNALASYESIDTDGSTICSPNGACPDSPSNANSKFTSGVFKFARIFSCPAWIVSCRNNLSHSSQYPPSLSVLHEAITFALEWMDRNFWAKLLGDQCRLVDVDLRSATTKDAITNITYAISPDYKIDHNEDQPKMTIPSYRPMSSDSLTTKTSRSPLKPFPNRLFNSGKPPNDYRNRHHRNSNKMAFSNSHQISYRNCQRSSNDQLQS